MISNLEQSVDFEAACHNAFEKTAAQIQQQADAYLKAGNFPTASVSGRALSMTRDFKPVQLASEDVPVAMADLLYASGHIAEAGAAYKALKGPEGSEGIALMDLDDQKDRDARTALQGAIDAGSKSARAWLELGRLQSDADELKKASDLNPRWGEPYFQLADLDAAIDKEQLEKRAELLKKAAALDPRSSDYWTALAKTDIAAKDFAASEKAWSGAERAAASDEERERIRKIRLQVQAKRFDDEAAERKRIKDEEAADLQRVKDQSDRAIRASEDAARKKMNPNGAAPPKPEGWYEAPKGGLQCGRRFPEAGLPRPARQAGDSDFGWKDHAASDGRSFASFVGRGRRENVQLRRSKTASPGYGPLQCEARCKAAHLRRSGRDRIPLSEDPRSRNSSFDCSVKIQKPSS